MELEELGKRPIRPEQPAGDDVRYDPVYEELVAEVDKFSSPSASGAVDWGKVVKLSSDILSQKSKDLLVASYLAVALIQTRKFEGVEIGSRIYRDLIEGHWDGLFPTKARMRGRIAAIEWWAEKAEGVLEQLPRGPFAEERINALNENLRKIDQILAEVLEEAPSIRPLLDFAGSLEAVAPPPEPKVPEPKPAPASPRPPEGSLATPGAEPSAPRVEEGPVEITSSETAYAVLEKALGDVARVAAYWREESPANPMAYRLLRMAAWGVLLVLAVVLPFFFGAYRVGQFTQALALAIAVLGLNLLVGYSGQISLGHGAFFALGAYASAISINDLGVPYLLTLPIAGVVCALAGFLLGLPALPRFVLAVLALAAGAVAVSEATERLSQRLTPAATGRSMAAMVGSAARRAAAPSRLEFFTGRSCWCAARPGDGGIQPDYEA